MARVADGPRIATRAPADRHRRRRCTLAHGAPGPRAPPPSTKDWRVKSAPQRVLPARRRAKPASLRGAGFAVRLRCRHAAVPPCEPGDRTPATTAARHNARAEARTHRRVL